MSENTKKVLPQRRTRGQFNKNLTEEEQEDESYEEESDKPDEFDTDFNKTESESEESGDSDFSVGKNKKKQKISKQEKKNLKNNNNNNKNKINNKVHFEKKVEYKPKEQIKEFTKNNGNVQDEIYTPYDNNVNTNGNRQNEIQFQKEYFDEKIYKTQNPVEDDSQNQDNQVQNFSHQSKKHKKKHQFKFKARSGMKNLTQKQLLEEALLTEINNTYSLKEMINYEEKKQIQQTKQNDQVITFFDSVKQNKHVKYIKAPNEEILQQTLPLIYNTNKQTSITLKKKKCLITGKEALYRDPYSLQYYYDCESYKIIREKREQKEEEQLANRMQVLSDLAAMKRDKIRKNKT